MPRKTVRNKITSEELTAKINPKNIELIKKFLKEKSIRTSPKTIVVYESNLVIFFTWNLLHNENKFFVDIKKLEFSNFFSFASEEMGVGSSKLNNMRSTLSSLSTFIEKFFDEDYPAFRNVILKVVDSAPREVRREKTILDDEQVENLLEYFAKTDKQKACWLALAICSGARLSELLRFTTDLIDEERVAFGDIFLETTKQIKTKGRGKGGKLLYKYILREKFLPHYRDWIIEREKILKENNLNHICLFIKPNGEPATPSTIRSWVEEIEDFLKVPFYVHSLRHFLVTLLSRNNIPQPIIQELMGWSSAEMVQVYDDSTLKDRNFDEFKNLKL